MRLSYENVLATGPFPKVRSVLARDRQRAVVVELGEDRWAVVPEVRYGVSSANHLACRISEATGGPAASFEVYDPDLLSVAIFHTGGKVHGYHSEQGHTITNWDENDVPFLIDRLGRAYSEDEPRPHGPYGDDPAPFTLLAAGPVDQAALGTVLSGPGAAAARHHDLLRHLSLDVPALRMTFEEAAASGLGRVTPGRLPTRT